MTYSPVVSAAIDAQLKRMAEAKKLAEVGKSSAIAGSIKLPCPNCGAELSGAPICSAGTMGAKEHRHCPKCLRFVQS